MFTLMQKLITISTWSQPPSTGGYGPFQQKTAVPAWSAGSGLLLDSAPSGCVWRKEDIATELELLPVGP